MFIAAAIVAGLLALTLLASARGKLVRDPQVMKVMTRVGVPDARLWLLATAEIAGAAGIVAGLFWWPIGVVAAAGVVIYFVGATGAHIRVKDRKLAPPVVLLVAAAAALVLRAVAT
jgi:DoxX-like protein